MHDHEQAKNVQLPRAEAIARLNDQLRSLRRGGTIVVTRGVMNLTGFDAQTLASAIAAYDGFDADNDPHGERDLSDLVLWDAELLWKIDYYDKGLQFNSDDPANAQVTKRVLTVMLGGEW